MPKKILLADDSITIQKVIQITFATEDYELTIVNEGDSAIRKARELRPDLIMADVAMPGKNGYEVCEAVKNDPSIKNTPVLLLAGTFEPLNKEEAERVKADDSIVKPFESQELIDKVRGLLAKAAPAAPPAKATEAPKAEVIEEPWSAGEFLGFTEELEKKEEITGAHAAEQDIGFLGGEGLFEETAKELTAPEEHGFFDLDLKEEEPKTATPARPATLAEEKPALQEPEIPEAVGFDLSSFEPEPFNVEHVEEEKPLESFKAEPFELEHFGMEEEAKKLEPPKAAPPKPVAPAAEPPKAAPPREEAPRFAELEPIEPAWGEKTEAAVSESQWQPEETELIEAPAGVIAQERKEEAFEIEEPWTVEAHEAQKKPEPAPPAPAKTPEKHPALRVVERAAGLTAERAKEAVSERGAGLGIPQEELQSMVEKIAREVIEGIAWEVIPDLAHELLETEMKKFRETWSKIK